MSEQSYAKHITEYADEHARAALLHHTVVELARAS
jgi:hypothetical protein